MPSGFIGSTPQATCHPDRIMHCKGLCEKCYENTRVEYKRNYQKNYHKINPTAKKRGHLKPLGWTLEMFQIALKSQDNRCAICSKPVNLDKKQNGARACADHVHSEPPVPRGVICTNCNAGIGQFQDNPSFLRKAAAYLELYQNTE